VCVCMCVCDGVGYVHIMLYAHFCILTGPAGHGSQFIENTATVKLNRVINHILKFRAEQETKLNGTLDIKSLRLGDVTSVNLTALKSGVENGGGGYNLNVIPTLATAGFDIRITPNQDMKAWNEMFAQWTAEEGVSVEHIQTKTQHTTPTSTDPEKNKWWKTFADVMEEHKFTYELRIFPAATDGRYLRDIGIPVFGFRCAVYAYLCVCVCVLVCAYILVSVCNTPIRTLCDIHPSLSHSLTPAP
jgi:aminoacylase